MVKGVAQQLDKILHEYVEKVDEVTDDVMHDVAVETVQDLRATSPRKSGDYARSWTWTQKGHEFIVHNKDHYRLTHLLNNGHIIRNKYGTYGRKLGDGHIERAEERSQITLVQYLESRLGK